MKQIELLNGKLDSRKICKCNQFIDIKFLKSHVMIFVNSLLHKEFDILFWGKTEDCIYRRIHREHMNVVLRYGNVVYR